MFRCYVIQKLSSPHGGMLRLIFRWLDCSFTVFSIVLDGLHRKSQLRHNSAEIQDRNKHLILLLSNGLPPSNLPVKKPNPQFCGKACVLCASWKKITILKDLTKTHKGCKERTLMANWPQAIRKFIMKRSVVLLYFQNPALSFLKLLKRRCSGEKAKDKSEREHFFYLFSLFFHVSRQPLTSPFRPLGASCDLRPPRQ